jgi:hypothetical protein
MNSLFSYSIFILYIVQVRYDMTYRSCLLQNVKANSSCEKQNSELPSNDPFRVYVDSAIFNGRKCVSNEAGSFPPNWMEDSNGATVLDLQMGVFINILLFTSCMCLQRF